MAESFEAKLTAATSKEVFKKAKQIMRNHGLVCCHEVSPGVLHAVCRDPDGFVSHAELRGFPNGPFSGTCTCRKEFPGFCPHALAAALYHAKYTIKAQPEESVPDLPPQFAGLKFSGLPELLVDMFKVHPFHVVLYCGEAFPHVSSMFENFRVTVRYSNGSREYIATQNNLRQLFYEKATAMLSLKQFSSQDRQIIRFLANYAQQEGGELVLSAEHCSNFFHCLIGFRYFKRLNDNIIVHESPAVPVLHLDKVKSGCLLRPAIQVRGSSLPLENIKLVSGQNGCWVGLLGEYWWVPAKTEVTELRSFLCSPVQLCTDETAKTLLDAKDLPIKVIPASGIKVLKRRFRPLYDGRIDDRGALVIELFFNYGASLCPVNHNRLASNTSKAAFWMRNIAEEQRFVDELIHFGFIEQSCKRGSDTTSLFTLSDRESIGMFVSEVVPRWQSENRNCLFSARLAQLCADSTSLQLKTNLRDRGDDWFELALHLTANGRIVSWKLLTESALRNESYLALPASDSLIRIPQALRALAASLASVVRFFPGVDDDPNAEIIRIPIHAAYYWADTASDLPGAVPNEFLRLKLDYDQIRETPGDCTLDKDLFHGELRPYQKNGVAWLNAMTARNCNLILADEMGLGKTVQLLAYLASSTQEHLPALIVCPTTLIHNWSAEIKRFLPRFRLLAVYGTHRTNLWKKVSLYDIVLTSYSLAKRDSDNIMATSWKSVILDEAQHIKNPNSQNAMMCKQIPSAHRIILTGTPLENSITDIWSIFDFLHPGFLGTLPAFRAKYAELERNASLKYELGRRIAPFILRRRKADVCAELPPKQEQYLYCEMEPDQRALYDQLEESTRSTCRAFREGRDGITKIHVLAAILRLRQICCTPQLLPDNAGYGISSAKLDLLSEILLENIDSGHKVLLFSQFTGMLGIIRDHLDELSVPYEYLDGSVRNREERIRNFSTNPDIRVFLLSLKVGGVGLNLTSADTVILFDPWWNPAAEDQATDRTHRIGQVRPVNCIRLVVRDSIEERILDLHARKRKLFDDLVEEPSESLSSLDLDDIDFLLG